MPQSLHGVRQEIRFLLVELATASLRASSINLCEFSRNDTLSFRDNVAVALAFVRQGPGRDTRIGTQKGGVDG